MTTRGRRELPAAFLIGRWHSSKIIRPCEAGEQTANEKRVLKSRLFWMVSRTARFLYRTFPVFGPLPGAVAIIRRDRGFVAIERNDGIGLSLPGGFSGFRESPEKTVRREAREETGLTITRAEFKYDFKVWKPLPAHTFVFEAEAEGELRGSWEGTPRVVSLEELRQRILEPQRRIVEEL
jgi:8-oxo-dGTP pyrophosphatase MutT (NUDIX family)